MDELAQRLQAPLDPEAVDFRPQGQLNDKGMGRVVAYIDARAVQDRLDEVFGAGGWSFDWQPLVIDNAVKVVKGTITIAGVSKSDIGDAGDTEPSKSAVSDALKRAAVQWGIGRYLYGLGTTYVKGRVAGKSWVPEDSEVARLRQQIANITPRQQQIASRTTNPTRPTAQQPAQRPTVQVLIGTDDVEAALKAQAPTVSPRQQQIARLYAHFKAIHLSDADAKQFYAKHNTSGAKVSETPVDEVTRIVDEVLKLYPTYDAAMNALEAQPIGA